MTTRSDYINALIAKYMDGRDEPINFLVAHSEDYYNNVEKSMQALLKSGFEFEVRPFEGKGYEVCITTTSSSGVSEVNRNLSKAVCVALLKAVGATEVL